MTGGIPKSVAETCFNEAVTCFEEFLSNQGLPSALWWVFQEDVVFRKDSVFIKTPIPNENRNQAEACYEPGRNRKFGVNLHAFCLFESRPCCYLILPEDDVDALAYQKVYR